MIRHVMPWRATGPTDLTLLTAQGRRLAKLITPAGIIPYDGAALFRVDARRVDSIEAVAELLLELAARSDTCVLRGRLKAPTHPDSEIPCRIHDRDGDPARFEEVPRRWVMIDLEPKVAPAYVDPTDPVIAGGYLRRLLPAPFQSARCVSQLSSSAGLEPGLRAHLWFLLDRALVKPELDRLLDGVAGLDSSTLRPRQLHYTASPRFVDVDDPCHERIAVLPGLAEVEVGALPPPCARPFPTPAAARPYAAPQRSIGFKATRPEKYMLRRLREIAEAPSGARHPTFVRVSASLFGLAKAGQLDPADVAARIQGAVALSSFDRDFDEVISALRWAWESSTPWRLR